MLNHETQAWGHWRTGCVVAAVAAALLLIAPAAEAACGGVQTEDPHREVNGHLLAPLAVGDSPMLLAVPNLANAGFRPNARGCRQYPEGLRLLESLKRQGKLPRLVIIALGSNGIVTEADLKQAYRIVVGNKKRKKRFLGLVTPRETGGGSSSDATRIRHAAHDYGSHVRLLDWVRYSAGHPTWFQPDGLHLTFGGAAAMTRLFKKLLPLADGRGRLHPRHHHRHGR
jgi:hypothetical protein